MQEDGTAAGPVDGLRRLADETAIRNLLARYSECLDNGDIDGFAGLFADARIRTDRNPDGYVGADGVRAMIGEFVLMYDGRPMTKHVVTNIAIDFDDDSAARVRSSVVVFQWHAAFGLAPVIAAHYADRCRRVGDGADWHFVERHITADLIGDLSRHVPALQPDG
jgi:3-phenylpropionate/cinnamic acid dioxygenase small subunit